MSKEAIFLGLPELFENKIKIHPPLVKDIVGARLFPTYRYLLTISQEELEDEYLKKDGSKNKNDFNVPTPLEFLLINSYSDKSLEKIAKQAFEFFIKEEVTFLYEQKMVLSADADIACTAMLYKTARNSGTYEYNAL